jgi:integrase
VDEQLITRNPTVVIQVFDRPDPARKVSPWAVDEARQCLESARRDDDALYAASVLLLVLGLRKGDLLGLTWEEVSLDDAEPYVSERLRKSPEH